MFALIGVLSADKKSVKEPNGNLNHTKCECTKRRLPKLERPKRLCGNPTKETKLKVKTKSDDTKNPVGSGGAIVVRSKENLLHGKERQVVLLIIPERYA